MLIFTITMSILFSVSSAVSMYEAISLHSTNNRRIDNIKNIKKLPESTSLLAKRLLPRERLPERPCSEATIALRASFTGPSGRPAARFARAVA